VGGVEADEAEILEMQELFASIDFDQPGGWDKLWNSTTNPLKYADWDAILGEETPDHEVNKAVHDYLNGFLDKPTPYGYSNPDTPDPTLPKEDTSPAMVKAPEALQGSTVNQVADTKVAWDTAAPGWATTPAFEQFKKEWGSTPDGWVSKAKVSDALQESIDSSVIASKNPAVSSDAPATLSIGGKQVTKGDLQAAVDAVKNSASTSVKGPLKEIDSPLAKVDIKAYIESDPLSDPFKGKNGKVHYGKLKEAVVSVLQAKADSLGDAVLPEEPAVTKAGPSTSSVDAPSVSPNLPSEDPEIELEDGPVVDEEDDFFDNSAVTPAGKSSADKVKDAFKNAATYSDPPEDAFTQAFWHAATTDEPGYADDDEFSESEADFEGVWNYEVIPGGLVYEVDEDGVSKKLNPDKVLYLLNGQFGSADGLDSDVKAAGVDLPDPGYYTGGGISLQVYADGSAMSTNLATGEKALVSTPGSVNALLSSSTLTKVSDNPDQTDKVFVKGVESGSYNFGNGTSVHVYPDGTVLAENNNGVFVADVAIMKPWLTNSGSGPQPLITDKPDWLQGIEKGPGGIPAASYLFGTDPDPIVVSKNKIIDSGSKVQYSPHWMADSFFSDHLTIDDNSVSGSPSVDDLPADSGPDDVTQALIAKAMAAPSITPADPNYTLFAAAFQEAVKSGSPVFIADGQLWKGKGFVNQPYSQLAPNGAVTKHAANGQLQKQYPSDSVAALLDDAFDGASVQPPVPSPPDSADEISPAGYWDDGVGGMHPIGTYTNGEDAFLEITEDGPQDLEDIGMESYEVSELIDSGELTWVPPQDSPVASTPSSLYDVDAPVLSTVTGHGKVSSLHAPQLKELAAKWAKESGFEGVAGLHLSTASKPELEAWLNHWAKGEWDQAFAIEASKVKNHKAKGAHPGDPANPANAGGFTKKNMPPAVVGEIPAGKPVAGSWPDPESSHYAWSEDQVDAYLLAANMQNPTGLTLLEKKFWALFHNRGDKIRADNLSARAQKFASQGVAYSEPITPDVQHYAPGQAVPLPSDFPEIDFSKASVQGWTPKQLDTYLSHVGSTKAAKQLLLKQSPEVKAGLVALHALAAAPAGTSGFKEPAVAKSEMKSLLIALESSASYDFDSDSNLIKNVLKVDKKTFTMDAVQPPLAGHSTIYHVTDEQGNAHLFKVAPENFRAEIEHAAHELAGLAGIEVADSQLGTFNGKFGQFQAKIPSKSTLKGVKASDLSLSALKNLMQAHVQDWTIANDDAHDDNFLLSPDGKKVIPIDIARAYVRFGQPGAMSLKLGALSSWEQPYYQKVYDAILSGKYSDGDVDELFRSSMRQARKTAAVDDASWSAAMAAGLKNRTNFGMTSAKNAEQLIEQALARKNALEADFDKFWSDIYSKLGRDKPSPKAGREKWVHSGINPELLEHAENMGSHGATAFFGGTGLEDGAMLAQVFGTTSGGKELHLTGQIRKSIDAKLRSWFASNLGKDISGATSSEDAEKKQFLDALGVSEYPQHVLSAAKTISHHHKQGDQNYNTTHMANFEAMKTDVASKLAAAEAGNWPPHVANWPEGQVEYKNLLNYYNGQLTAVQQLKDFNGQSKVGDFDPFSLNLPKKTLEAPVEKEFEVVKISSYSDSGSIDDNGNTILDGKKSTQGQTGTTYQLTLPDGTQIEYRSWHSGDGVVVAQQGELRIKVRQYDGSSSGVDGARAALSKMGVDFNDATEEDLELFYYRHLYGVMTNRKDASVGKMQEVAEEVKANLPGGAEGTPALTAKEELERWRKAWSRLDPKKFNTFLADRGWMPRFSRVNTARPDQRGGLPFWERFDYDDDFMNKQQLFTHSLSQPELAAALVKSGGLLSTESRTKFLGKWYGGMSSSSDQGYGSSDFVYLRQNQASSAGAQIFVSPRVSKRTSNYAYNSDNFGNMKVKSTAAPFDQKAIAAMSASSNELMIKRMVSLMDDIEMIVFQNEANRQEAIKYLKSHGITSIRGMLIEDRLVLQKDRKEALEKINKHRQTWKEEDDE
jgi:hypothetical protein